MKTAGKVLTESGVQKWILSRGETNEETERVRDFLSLIEEYTELIRRGETDPNATRDYIMSLLEFLPEWMRAGHTYSLLQQRLADWQEITPKHQDSRVKRDISSCFPGSSRNRFSFNPSNERRVEHSAVPFFEAVR